jgi:hypothetical protein
MKALRQIRETVMSLLRELGDENAYQRHLDAHGLEHTGANWREFQEKRLGRKYKNAKCC